jgi:hypothetical protein
MDYTVAAARCYMALSEELVKDKLTPSAGTYANRVRWLAVVYIVLNIVSLGITVAIAWRVQFFVTLAQRSNVETLVLAIIFVLAAYYLISTFRGFAGALRMAWLNMPVLWARTPESRDRIEHNKQDALRAPDKPNSAFFDQAVRLKGKLDQPIRWRVGDSAGEMGELELDGVKITYYPRKGGINNSVFEFITDQLEYSLCTRGIRSDLQVVRWGSINDDEAASYYSTVRAFQNLERNLRQDRAVSALWPTVEIEQEDIDRIQSDIEKLVPVLRNESLLPNLEYEVEWTVPILPEPLGFMQLKRHENRADPVFTMGCATLIVLVILSAILLFIIAPPWVPSK